MKRQYSSETRFKSILVGFPIFFAITYNIPRFFELETIPRFFELETTINDTYFSNKAAINGSEIYYNSEEFVGVNNITVLVNCTLNKTYVVEDLGYGGTLMRQNYLYIVFYIFWSKFIFIELVPWVTVFVLNLMIWKKVREFEAIRRESLGIQSGMNFYCNIYKLLLPYKFYFKIYFLITRNFNIGTDNRQTKILISIVVVFILCQSLTIVADIYEAVSCSQLYMDEKICLSNDHIENIIDIAHFALSFNSSINFLFYVVYDPNFRKSFVKVVMLFKILDIYLIRYYFTKLQIHTSIHFFVPLQIFGCTRCISLRQICLPKLHTEAGNIGENETMMELQQI